MEDVFEESSVGGEKKEGETKMVSLLSVRFLSFTFRFSFPTAFCCSAAPLFFFFGLSDELRTKLVDDPCYFAKLQCVHVFSFFLLLVRPTFFR